MNEVVVSEDEQRILRGLDEEMIGVTIFTLGHHFLSWKKSFYPSFVGKRAFLIVLLFVICVFIR